jgi:hypothetical protein
LFEHGEQGPRIDFPRHVGIAREAQPGESGTSLWVHISAKIDTARACEDATIETLLL